MYFCIGYSYGYALDPVSHSSPFEAKTRIVPQHFRLGFIGAPIAVVCIQNLLPLLLLSYILFVDGKQCWHPLNRAALRNWGPMVRLALPGLIMIEAEFICFEIQTLAASWISPTHLAAQSVLTTISSCMYSTFPFPISIAAGTRVAQLVGATLDEAARKSARVATLMAAVQGTCTMVILFAARNHVPRLFTSDPDVADLASKLMPFMAAYQMSDALSAMGGGLLRGIGRQELGGYLNLFAYYVVC